MIDPYDPGIAEGPYPRKEAPSPPPSSPSGQRAGPTARGTDDLAGTGRADDGTGTLPSSVRSPAAPWVRIPCRRLGKDWRAPSERVRTAAEIPVEVDLTDGEAVPTYVQVSGKVLHLRRLRMDYASICKQLGINRWMALKAVRWSKTKQMECGSEPRST